MKNNVLIFLVIFCLQIAVYGKTWNGIIPLQSTRKDVEKILGKSEEKGDYVSYSTEDAGVLITYKTCDIHCCENERYGWKVPNGTVIEISVSPDKLIPFHSLKLNLKNFVKQYKVTDTPGNVYIDTIEGFLIETHTGFNTRKDNEVVGNFIYGATRKETIDKMVDCKVKDRDNN